MAYKHFVNKAIFFFLNQAWLLKTEKVPQEDQGGRLRLIPRMSIRCMPGGELA